MNSKMITGIICGFIAALAIAGIYRGSSIRRRLRIKDCKALDTDFVANWIANKDLSEYNPSYTCIVARGSELLDIMKKSDSLDSFLVRFIPDYNKLFLIAIFDKSSNSIVTKEYYWANKIADELSSTDFIEFPFEP